MQITLKASAAGTGGTVTVRDRPTGDRYKSELGETFDGSGTWDVEGGSEAGDHARVHLSFTEPELFLRVYTVDMLSVATDSEHTYLYEDDDPDVCPAFRLRPA